MARQVGRITWQFYDAAETSRLPAETDYAAVFNLATPGAAEAAAQPETARQQALTTVEQALHLVTTGRARRLIHFSTFHVYGAPSPETPRTWYGRTTRRRRRIRMALFMPPARPVWPRQPYLPCWLCVRRISWGGRRTWTWDRSSGSSFLTFAGRLSPNAP
ncbi:NAD-dependent epimerase/dehydratase family protein [Chloracidobacterium thermophilum]|nr:NAD-dependent epimerase/dehydratase family protein [Chloracidobacterium thermophilum]